MALVATGELAAYTMAAYAQMVLSYELKRSPNGLHM
jgi:hypothetical protein